jgi:F420-non-reducing hydrogenase small subunit
MGLRIVEEWFAYCGGCEIALLDIGEKLLEILPNLDFLHIPALVDHKFYGQLGDHANLEIPEADVGIVTGAVRNEENKLIAQEMRKKCKIIIADGSCACFGGVPSLANMYLKGDMLDKVYTKTKSTILGATPSTDLPPLLDRVYALDEIIKVDVYVPGCPTSPDLVAEALTALLQNKPFKLPEKSVCDDCPLKREKKALTSIKRNLEPPTVSDRCLLERGYLCLGPATRTGCGGKERTPQCIRASMPCTGCFGPVRQGASQMVEMMGALSSIGLDPKTILDRLATFNMYTGAKAGLRPIKV